MIERREIKFNRATLREQQRFGPSTWRPRVHLTWVAVNADGRPVATVKELGFQLPKKDRRYAARIEGVQWLTSNTLSPDLRFLPIRGFETAKAAMSAVDEARAIILASTEEDAEP